MEDAKITLENGSQSEVKGIFYIYNSKYYFIYTQGENVDSDYVQLYMVQVCKEIQNTLQGPIDTGYMLGIQTADQDEWSKVQTCVTKIIDSKKNGIAAPEIQYLPINMLVNLKIISKNKFKLLSHTLKEAFNIDFTENINNLDNNPNQELAATNSSNIIGAAQSIPQSSLPPTNVQQVEDIIIDYRAKYFEEQDKNKELEERIKMLEDKIDSIKSII